MTYNAGGNIQASDYNAFATIAGGINELYGDLYPGSTSLPEATYGYGQTPPLSAVAAGNSVTAAEWAALFQNMKNCGTHQGTTTVPPLPASNPSAGNSIIAYSSISTLLATLKTNRYNLAAGQSSLTSGTQYSGSGTWTSELTYTFQVNFGSWNNARYFFNSGGFLGISGFYTSPTTPAEISWSNALNSMSILKFNATSTVPGTGSATSIGFYNLTTTYQTVYLASPGGSSYSNSQLIVRAKLSNSAGTNGLIDFQIALDDNDVTPDTKSSDIKFWCDNTKSSGAVTYPGTVSVSAGTFTYS